MRFLPLVCDDFRMPIHLLDVSVSVAPVDCYFERLSSFPVYYTVLVSRIVFWIYIYIP